MSGSNSRNVALRQTKRPGSAKRTTENDPLEKNDPPDPCSSEFDFSAFLDAIKTIQKVDLNLLRRRLNGTVPRDLKNEQNGKDTNPRWVENVDWKTKYMDLKEKFDKFTKQIEDKQELEDKLKHITAQLKTTEQTSSEQKKELVLLQQRVESGDKSLKDLNQQLKECMNELELKEKRLQTQQKAMKEVTKAKDDALTRPVHQIGQQISEGDPNIPDLSEQNRPSKLGEMYFELYDNEWTDAFEVLTEKFHLSEKTAIQLLLKILWESSKHASDMSQSAMKTIETLISGSLEGPTPDCKRLLREARKHVDIKKADDLFQEFVREKLKGLVGQTYLGNEKVVIYSKKCFQLCWLMSIQDPPVVLSGDPETGARFDSNLYRRYTISGDNVDYVVWPALLLHKYGPVLAKGVAESSKSPRAKSSSAVERLVASDDKFFDSRSQSQYDKVQESTSGPDGMDKTQYMHQTRYDEKLREPTTASPGQRDLSQRMQAYPHQMFRNVIKKKRGSRDSVKTSGD
ncbi:hypothetical protein CHS0354_026372 [Potamilus streckersoni]|uniref:Mitochondria-eating protein n=1 Tax=Potamilus streckersoni TaxID=2493646 RepID=A0AAE0W611_9BIVA|nr:hypothetical protein CHS0354_026372 [Potamilus streckersoni]